jgi:predicted ABC-type ATPase
MVRPRAIIIAGPNGAGKTTFAREFLVAEGHCPIFLNADLIAAGLAPLQPEMAASKAMRLMASEIRTCIENRQDFSVESTLSGRSYVSLIKEWQAADYLVKIVFLRIDAVELCLERVRLRVALGGHDIPIETIRRRFEKGWENFQNLYRPMADAWQIYDACYKPPRLIDEGKHFKERC